MNPNYPIYVISKGRWESRQTSKALEKIGVPYRIVVEPQEYSNYAKVIDINKILVCPFGNLNQGGAPVRNWVWEYSVAKEEIYHWILDDNIRCFYRFNKNLKVPVSDGTIFRVAEKFIERYENVALSGFQYFMFVSRKVKTVPFYLNTRIYSCILVKNSIPYRWRGLYNSDTDLSIRVLKDGYCTVLFNAFLAEKSQTMTIKGGNTSRYQGDGRFKMAQSLQRQHPDVTKIAYKWGRWQHQVDYRQFKKNKLIKKDGVIIQEGVDNYGMNLKNIS